MSSTAGVALRFGATASCQDSWKENTWQKENIHSADLSSFLFYSSDWDEEGKG